MRELRLAERRNDFSTLIPLKRAKASKPTFGKKILFLKYFQGIEIVSWENHNSVGLLCYLGLCFLYLQLLKVSVSSGPCLTRTFWERPCV